MTENTVTTTTPAERLKAMEEYNRLEAKLSDWGANDKSPEYRAHIQKMHELNKIRYAPDPTPAPAGPDWKARREHRETQRTLRSELLEHTAEGSVEAKAIIQDIIDEHTAFDAKQPPQLDPFAYTEADADRAAERDGWTPPAIAQGHAFREALGLTPLDGEQFRLAIRDAVSPWVGRDLPSDADLDLDELWGNQADENIKAVGHVRTTLKRQFPGEWEKVIPYLGIAGVVQALAKVGRLAKR